MEKLININMRPTTDDSEFPKQIRPISYKAIRARESGGQVLPYSIIIKYSLLFYNLGPYY